MASGGSLEAIVTHCGSRIQSILDVTLFEQATLLRAVAPDAREAVGLELETHGDGICGPRLALL